MKVASRDGGPAEPERLRRAPTLWASSVSHKYSVIGFDRALSSSGESAAGCVPDAGPHLARARFNRAASSSVGVTVQALR